MFFSKRTIATTAAALALVGIACAGLQTPAGAQATLGVPPLPSPEPPVVGTGTGLYAQYYDNRDLTALKVTRVDPTVDFNWGTGSPDPSIGPNDFSVRWSGEVQAQYSAAYTFYTGSDDGVRLWVNGELIIDKWRIQGGTEWPSKMVELLAGQKYSIVMEYFEAGAYASAHLSWSSSSSRKQIVPRSQLYVPCPGLDPTKAEEPVPPPYDCPHSDTAL